VSVRAVVVAHREALAAEGIAAALGRYPALALVGIATTAEATERCAQQADAVAIDGRIPGALVTVGRLLKRGLRVVVIGEATASDGGEGRVVVGLDAPMAHLASALAPGAQALGSGADDLSHREAQVLRLAAKGMAGKQIARSLGISPKTVEQHKTRAFRRLGVPNQAAAVAMLIEKGARSWSASTT
jgi:DNA-binding CsgD family transcriptional regulator